MFVRRLRILAAQRFYSHSLWLIWKQRELHFSPRTRSGAEVTEQVNLQLSRLSASAAAMNRRLGSISYHCLLVVINCLRLWLG